MELFKETFVACNISVISVAFSGMLIAVRLSLPIVTFSLLVILWAVINAIVFSLIARRKLAKINKLMYDCDLENYLPIIEGLAKRRTDKATKADMLLNLAAAYMLAGNNSEAGKLLYSIDTKHFAKAIQTRTEARCELAYHNNFFVYYCKLNNLQGAAQALEQMKNVLQKHNLPRSVRNTYSAFFLRQQCTLSMAYGHYGGAEQIFDLAFERAKNTLDKVSAKYMLGKIYLHHGRIIHAQRAFEYAVAHGGSSIFRTAATERLEALGRTVCALHRRKPPVKVFSTAEKAALAAYCGLVACAAIFVAVSRFAGLW